MKDNFKSQPLSPSSYGSFSPMPVRNFSQAYYGESPTVEDNRFVWWKRLLPLAVVVVAGALAYHFGFSAGANMAGQISQLDTKTSELELSQRVTIGDSNPDLMIVQPTPMPEVPVVVIDRTAPRAAAHPRVASRPTTPNYSPFEDNSIPFAPAEAYAPDEKTAELPNVQAPDSGEIKTPLPDPTAPPEETPPTPLAASETSEAIN